MQYHQKDKYISLARMGLMVELVMGWKRAWSLDHNEQQFAVHWLTRSGE